MERRTAPRTLPPPPLAPAFALGALSVLSCAARTAEPVRPVAVPQASSAPAPALAFAVRPSSARLEAALDSVHADEIRSDVFFIASDELGGRDTPSLGQRIAARYIRARLVRLGWRPGARDGYFYTYPLSRRRIDEEASRITWEASGKAHALRPGRDYFFPSTFDLEDLSASGAVAFCGSGTKEELEKAGVAGKWALCFDAGVEIRRLRGPARQAGAIGLIVAPGPGYAGKPYAERFASDLERQRRGGVSWPSGRPRERTNDTIPQLFLTREAVTGLLASAGSEAATPEIGADLGITLAETRKIEGEVLVENVCGFWPGDDPELSREVVIVSAHYDHVGTREGVVYNGADDNGSGTCGLLAIAQALARYGPMRRSVLLLWVSGEEKGLWGSQAWTENPWLPEGCRPIADVNIDMIGRNAPEKLLITPTKARKEYNGLVRLFEQNAPLEGFPELGSCDSYWSRSDHKNFSQNLKIPVTFLFSDVHPDYHEPGDDAEKIDADKIRRVSRLVVRVLDGLQGDKLEL